MKKLIVFSLVALFASHAAFAADGVIKDPKCAQIVADVKARQAAAGGQAAAGDKSAAPSVSGK